MATTGDARTIIAKNATLQWIAIGLTLSIIIGFSWQPSLFSQALAVALILFAFAHACFNYGWRIAFIFFVICVVVTFIIENLGSATGFPFGSYHFAVGRDLPHIGLIPLIVGPLWFGMGYFSWMVASILLDGADRNMDSVINRVSLPIVAAFVMSQWDFVMDAPEATIEKAWIWHHGGAVFGVPLTNFLGWLLTSWLFYQGFTLYLGFTRPCLKPNSRKFKFIAVLFYASAGLTHIVPWALGQNGEISDLSGQVWHIQSIREAAVAMMLFTMFFTSVLAVLRLINEKKAEQTSLKI